LQDALHRVPKRLDTSSSPAEKSWAILPPQSAQQNTFYFHEWSTLNEAARGLGQNAKYSSRVDVFRFAPNNRHAVTAPP
jgi:hypothetical protein